MLADYHEKIGGRYLLNLLKQSKYFLQNSGLLNQS